MIQGESVLGVIPARGGSKGVPRKNIRLVNGRPLIAWTIEAALGSAYLDRVIVSTDSCEIADLAIKLGAEVPFLRPTELAADDTPGVAPVLHAIDTLPEYSWVVLLQPTSPLRISKDIDGCMETCIRYQAPACVSVTPAAQNPYLMFTLSESARLKPLLGWQFTSTRRQELPASHVLNGAVYVAKSNWLKETGSFVNVDTAAFVMPQERSLDIDSDFDFRLFQIQLGEKENDDP